MNEPELRFKTDDGSEFSEWEIIPFKDVFSGLNNNTLSRDCLNDTKGTFQDIHYGDVLIKYGSILDMKTDEVPYVNDDIDCTKYDSLRDGDIVIADTAEDETVGKMVEIQNIDNSSVVSGLHTMAWRPKHQFAPMYLGFYMNSPSYHNQLRPYMQGIKVTSVSKSNIILTHILAPCLEEQQKIADLFSTLDNVINSIQEEVDSWEQMKRGVMQKLFSQEVRFKADDGTEYPEWEEDEIGSFLRIRDVKQVPTKEAPLMAFIANVGVADKGERYDRSFLVKDSNKKYKRTELNDFIYSSNNLDVGSIGLNTYGTAVISVVYEIFKPKDNVIPIVLSYIIQQHRIMNEILKYRQGCLYGQYKIYPEDFLSVKIKMPCFEEQQKIADCLSEFDLVIEKTKQKLEAYKQLKKGLMQRMFV